MYDSSHLRIWMYDSSENIYFFSNDLHFTHERNKLASKALDPQYFRDWWQVGLSSITESNFGKSGMCDTILSQINLQYTSKRKYINFIGD